MDHTFTLEIVIILPILLVEVILIDIQLLEHELVIPMDMINLLIETTLHIDVLDTISMMLSPNSLQGHIVTPLSGLTQLADPNWFRDARLILFIYIFIKFSFSKML